MNLIINNENHTTESKTLSALAVELALPERGVAVAVENKLVQRSNWESFPLAENQKITIVRAACGG